MGARFLLDTSIIIYILNNSLPVESLDFMAKLLSEDGCNISVISQMEILGFKSATEQEQQKAQDLIDDATIFALTEPIVQKTIELRRQHKTKLPDAIIAATALVHDLTLVSRNDGDFKRIPDLKYLNPFTDIE